VATLKKYDIHAEKVDEVEIKDNLLTMEANGQMIKDYIVALRANQRQWSASSKNRREVAGTSKKPHPQKGTGRARQGEITAPQYRGGGVVFGPKPKFDQHVKVNKKEKRKAIRFLFSSKIKEEMLHLLAKQQKVEKTKQIADFMSALNMQNKRVLFVGGESEKESNKEIHRCLRNIPKVEFVLVQNVNGYDLAASQQVVLLESAYEEFMQLLTDKGK